MPKFYLTLGQSHAHRLPHATVDKDCVVEIEADDIGQARAKAFTAFGDKWHRCLVEDDIDNRFMSYFPRGVIQLEPE